MKQNKIWPVLRDAIILIVLTGLGGFILGFASTDHTSRFYFYGLALSNGLFCTIGFTISGCLAVGNRWRHLAFVAAIVWAAGIFNVIFFNVSIIMWMASVVAIAIFALIGGGISFLFARNNLVEMPCNTGDDKFYDEVAREMQDKPLAAGLWAKAYAETGGDDAKARARYIQLRVAELERNERQKNRHTHEQKKMQSDKNYSQSDDLGFWGGVGAICGLVILFVFFTIMHLLNK